MSTQRPFILGVLQRIEYRYGNKEQLLAPKLDGKKKFGTFGMIDLTTIFWYPTIPGRLYHPIDNREEAEWWLAFYKENGEFVRAFFVPAPEQIETRLPFEVPDLGVYDIPDPGDDWYSHQYAAGPYTK
jgi:hypothetical protein